jgi:RsiW-degrading membrane proteinase PrsW (M82 family)
MRVGIFVRRFLIAFAAIPLGIALILGLPLGAMYLLGFLSEWVELAAFVPGFGLYVFGVCVPVGLVQWRRYQMHEPSSPMRLPTAGLLIGGCVLSISLGQLLLVSQMLVLFWPLYVVAAALPPLIALSVATQRLGGGTTWRRGFAGLLSGSFLSTQLTVFLTAAVSILIFMLVVPVRELTAHVFASRDLEELFYSPTLVFALVASAVVAPLVEELTKPLAAVVFARRLRGPAEAFLVGMAGGVGFAVVENMLYEAAGGELWAGIATLRAIGGVLHPLNAGLVAVGWYGVRHGAPGAWRRLVGLFGLAVGFHALWNGSLTLLLSTLGAYVFGADTWQINVYGIGQPGVILACMLVETLVLWRVLFIVTAQLREPNLATAQPSVGLHLERPKRLALWSIGLLVLLVPLAALYAPLVEPYMIKVMPLG